VSLGTGARDDGTGVRDNQQADDLEAGEGVYVTSCIDLVFALTCTVSCGILYVQVPFQITSN
jgi:hypothetical protein